MNFDWNKLGREIVVVIVAAVLGAAGGGTLVAPACVEKCPCCVPAPDGDLECEPQCQAD